MPKKLTQEEVIKRFKEVHGYKYDYSLVEYNNSQTKVIIKCFEHGLFYQSPAKHIYGRGCVKCGKIHGAENKIKHHNKKRNWDFEQPEDYKLIPLTKGKFAKVDNEDFDKLKNINWSVTSMGYAGNKVIKYMHRYIMNCPDDKVIDHINHDTLDNRKSNLRICSQQQNCFNQFFKTGTSKYKGVYKLSKNRLVSSIVKNGVTNRIGVFNSEIKASISYDKKAIELFGEFALLNNDINIVKNTEEPIPIKYNRSEITKNLYRRGILKNNLPVYRKEEHPNNKKVIAFHKDTGELFMQFFSISEATRFLNKKSVSAIVNNLKGNSKSAFGYVWKYKNK